MKLKFFIAFIFFILVSHFILADTTFFDNTNDAYIMSNSTLLGLTEGGASSSTSTSFLTTSIGCNYDWNCTNWGVCLPSGEQVRTCINIGSCSNLYDFPETNQNCTYNAQNVSMNNPPETKGGQTFSYLFIGLGIISIITFIILFYLKKNYLKKQLRTYTKHF